MDSVYLHGKLEDDAGFDLFGISGIEEELSDGVYDCQFRGKPCRMWIWTPKGCIGRQKGLVAYLSDLKSVLYAQECFMNKVFHL